MRQGRQLRHTLAMDRLAQRRILDALYHFGRLLLVVSNST
ncbi:hypothetical protein ACCUM_3105 [Candidatus Accumulibacter phosphatis]|uniref:Uncharacterized protein n=1 Tax=Candidatus Accumulibacter phosphatis TaxID=327160 RepID=A0A5S4EHY5_9PROT|nr:hypothetical protein ACCUM_3105 [Candidatus Accumulibacter phosphatis]